MDQFFPFIHEPKRKKKEASEPQPLYIELGIPPLKQEKDEENEETRVVIIEIL